MGQLLSRHTDETVENVQHTHEQHYFYPPRGGGRVTVISMRNHVTSLGNYFGAHFLLGGDKFDIAQPEAFLFGENADLRMLAHVPVPVRYQTTDAYNTCRTHCSFHSVKHKAPSH